MTSKGKVLETVEIKKDGKIHKAELRELDILSIDDQPLFELWFAGDQDGVYKAQCNGKANHIMPMWDKIKSMATD